MYKPDEDFMDLEYSNVHALSILNEFGGEKTIFSPTDFEKDVQDLREHGVNRDAYFPFWDRYGDKFALRPREVTILFGSRGSYKSTVANYLVADCFRNGMKVGYLSYEMDTPYLLSMMVNQLGNNPKPSNEYVSACLKAMKDKVFVINSMVDKPDSAIAKVKALLQDGETSEDGTKFGCGCKLIVLDCLQRIHMPMNDINLERAFVVELTNLVREHNAHLILIHHSRKGSHSDGDNPKPVIDDLKGSGGLADNAHNVIACWSNKKKKDVMFWINHFENSTHRADWDKANEMHSEHEELLKEPDIRLLIKKQRLSGFEGTIGLWRSDNGSLSFYPKGGTPFNYQPVMEEADAF